MFVRPSFRYCCLKNGKLIKDNEENCLKILYTSPYKKEYIYKIDELKLFENYEKLEIEKCLEKSKFIDCFFGSSNDDLFVKFIVLNVCTKTFSEGISRFFFLVIGRSSICCSIIISF